MNGKVIVIDGLDGSGKQTQTDLLQKRLKNEGKLVRAISFPDYEQPSSSLVKQYLAGDFGQAEDVSAYAASSFYAVDRYASFQQFWKNDYRSGYTIVADRYTTSNMIHQMSKLPQEQWDDFAQWLQDFEYEKMGLPKPDLVIYLDMNPNVSKKLLSARYHGDESKKDIHEANFAYMQRCRVCALYAAKKFHWHLVHCSDDQSAFSIDSIAEQVYRAADFI